MAVGQVEDLDLWVESEIARQLQAVSLADDNSDAEAEEEPDLLSDCQVRTPSQ